jgi:tetratricopeptide (TPR) repeat protein
MVASMRGDFQRGMVWQRQLLARLAGDLGHERFGLTILIAVNARHALAASASQLGAFRDGIAAGEEAIRLAEAADHPSSLIAACFGLGSLLVRKGDLAPARVVLGRGLELCDTWDLRVWRPWVGAPLGYTYVLDGRLAEALPLLEQAVELSRSRAQGGYALSSQGWLAEAYWLDGRSEEGLQLAEQALDGARTRGQRGFEAWALRLLGDMASQSTPVQVEQAEAYYGEALTLADELGMRPLQAHCHLGLGTLYARIGRRDEARAALAVALDLYRTLEMTFWLSQAEAALTQVEQA